MWFDWWSTWSMCNCRGGIFKLLGSHAHMATLLCTPCQHHAYRRQCVYVFRHSCRNVALKTLFATSGYLSNCGLQWVHSFPFDSWLQGDRFMSFGTILFKNPRDGYDVVEIPAMSWKSPLGSAEESCLCVGFIQRDNFWGFLGSKRNQRFSRYQSRVQVVARGSESNIFAIYSLIQFIFKLATLLWELTFTKVC